MTAAPPDQSSQGAPSATLVERSANALRSSPVTNDVFHIVREWLHFIDNLLLRDGEPPPSFQDFRGDRFLIKPLQPSGSSSIVTVFLVVVAITAPRPSF